MLRSKLTRRRSMWKVIRKFVPSKDSGKPVYRKDHKILANEFNEYFASVRKATADKVKKLAEENNIQITITLPGADLGFFVRKSKFATSTMT